MNVLRSILGILWSPETKPRWLWVIATPGLIALLNYLAVAPVGSWIFLWFGMFFDWAFLAAVIALFVLPFLFFSRKRRKSALAWWWLSACYLPLAFGGFMLGAKIRTSAFRDLAARSAPLVSAIRRFTGDHQAPPESLDRLVPQYLSEVPKTGIMAYPEYRYETGEHVKSYEGNPWILRVPTPSGGINFDAFLYFPLQNYPTRGYGGSFERIGDWAYLHE